MGASLILSSAMAWVGMQPEGVNGTPVCIEEIDAVCPTDAGAQSTTLDDAHFLWRDGFTSASTFSTKGSDASLPAIRYSPGLNTTPPAYWFSSSGPNGCSGTQGGWRPQSASLKWLHVQWGKIPALHTRHCGWAAQVCLTGC